MFKRIKQYFINRMYKNCCEEILWHRNFYRQNVLLGEEFKDYDASKKFKIFEEEILLHIPFDAYKIYFNKFKEDALYHLKLDAFGYVDLKEENVSILLNEYYQQCR